MWLGDTTTAVDIKTNEQMIRYSVPGRAIRELDLFVTFRQRIFQKCWPVVPVTATIIIDLDEQKCSA